METIALIPARGGSKRIARKNIRDFLGQPIIAYSIQAALEAGCFDRVIVSTDDPEIADVAKHYGAEVPFTRPPELADDYCVLGDVVEHCIQWLSVSGVAVGELCCIYATAPMVAPADICRGLETLRTSGTARTALAVSSFAFPIQRAQRIDSDGLLQMVEPQHQTTRSQDLEPRFHDAGHFFWVNNRGDESAFHGTIPVVVDRFRVQDIDTEEDWIRAENLYKANQANHPE